MENNHWDYRAFWIGLSLSKPVYTATFLCLEDEKSEEGALGSALGLKPVRLGLIQVEWRVFYRIKFD
jgi:hypothetical protein